MQKGALFIVFFTVFICNIYAQSFTRVGRIPFYIHNTQLKSPFTGGMNASIVNSTDLNNDGKKDLVIVHNHSYKISTYLSQGGQDYIYAPRYETYFPRGLGNFILKDFNEDGLEDVFYMDNPYIYIYKGLRINDSTLAYSLLDTFQSHSYDTLIPVDYIVPMVYYMPLIEDLDGDGDMDVVYINRSNRLVYHRNLKKEKGLTANKNEFWKYNEYWGQHAYGLNPLYYASGIFPRVVQGLANPSGTGTGNNILRPRHDEFQMPWHLDVNNDGLYDIVSYSENQRNGPLAVNIGSKDSAYFVHRDTFFPSYSQPIKKIMPIGFWTDADHDGKRDILSSFLLERDNDPNLSTSAKAYNDDVNTIELYKNYGSKPSLGYNDSFAIASDSFLCKETIDVGTRSAPIFYDYNGDSLLDILIPNSLKRDSWDVGNITYYKNIGTDTIPKYEFVTNDLFGYKSKSRVDIRIAVGDLNNDGNSDLIVASYKRTIYSTNPEISSYIHFDVYYQKYNTVTHSAFYLYDTLNINSQGKFGQANMCLYDANKDGLLDLFMGDIYSIQYYQNLGSAAKPDFSIVTNRSLISSDSLVGRAEELNFYPAVRIDPTDKKPYLYFAYFSRYGRIGRAYLDTNVLKVYDSFLKIDSKDVFSSYNLSINRNPTISFGDINGDDTLEMLVGNYAGGIQLFSFSNFGDIIETIKPPTVAIQNGINPSDFEIFPNPFQSSIYLYSRSSTHKLNIAIYSVDGKEVRRYEKHSVKESIDLENLLDGFYFIHIQSENDSGFTRKIQKISSY